MGSRRLPWLKEYSARKLFGYTPVRTGGRPCCYLWAVVLWCSNYLGANFYRDIARLGCAVGCRAGVYCITFQARW